MSSGAHDIEQDNTDNGGGPKGQAGYYEGTDYSLPYLSPWSRIVDDPTTAKLLRHLNCSFMGAPGLPPTLLALKQHAQSLAVLIAHLEPTISSGRVDGLSEGEPDRDGQLAPGGGASTHVDRPDRRLDAGGAFDWLASLSIPYYNDDPNHHRPLNALLNEVHSRSDAHGTQHWCPLTQVPARRPRDATIKGLADDYQAEVATTAFASHANLARHANECLERLDHEFSATGGILSLLPPDDDDDNDDASAAAGAEDDKNEFAAARNTLLGQMLLHMQAMYLRMHEFELDVGHMRDALAKDAVAPMQSLAATAPDAAAGRALVVGQDRYVLVNAGDDTWRRIHGEFDRQEARLAARGLIQREAGLIGGGGGGDGQSSQVAGRSVVPLDVHMRLYRLQGHGHSTIFVSPAFGDVEGTGAAGSPGFSSSGLGAQDRGVVGLVQPRWPERVSEWERRYKEQIASTDKLRRGGFEAARDKANLAEQVDHLRHELEAREHAREVAVAALAAVEAAGAGAGEDEDTEARRAAATRRIGELTVQLGTYRARHTEASKRLLEAEAGLAEVQQQAAAAAAAARANEHQHYRHIANALGRAVDAMAKTDFNDPEVTAQLRDAISRAVQQEQANSVASAAGAAGAPRRGTRTRAGPRR